MGSHINQDGEFQSDKYPTCPAGKVPLSTKDETAQDLLWEYAQRRRPVDSEFSVDLEQALLEKGFGRPPDRWETPLVKVARAAGVEDADTLGAIVQRVQALHDGVLRSHRVVPDEKGFDVCGDCGADIEDALTDGMVCPHYGKSLAPDFLTIEDVVRLFPNRSLALYRVERGPPEKRALTWKATWDAGYFTSDTDRHVRHESRSEAFGSTPEAALDALVNADLKSAQQKVELYEKELADATQALAELTKKVHGT